MKAYRMCIRIGFLLLVISLSFAFADDTVSTQKSTLRSFKDARDQRTKILADMPRLNLAIDELQRKQNNAEYYKMEIDKQEQSLKQGQLRLTQFQDQARSGSPDEKKAATKEIANLVGIVQTTQSRINFIKQRLDDPSFKRVDEELKAKLAEKDQKQKDLETAENMINDFLKIGRASCRERV